MNLLNMRVLPCAYCVTDGRRTAVSVEAQFLGEHAGGRNAG
jgi:hypothetical protein